MSTERPPKVHLLEHDPLVSGEVPAVPQYAIELCEKVDALVEQQKTIAAVMQSHAETQLAVYSTVQSLAFDVGELRGEVRARIPPGYRWASLCCLVLMTIALWRIAFSEPAPSSEPAVQTARLGRGS